MRDRLAAARRHYGDNYFFAVLPDPETAERIAAYAATLRGELGLRGSFIPAERLHISLCGVPYLPPSVLAALKEAAEHTEMPPFTVMFDHVMSYPGSRALVLCEGGSEGTVGLNHLHEAIGKVMAAARLHHIWLKGRFTPHLTLMRGDSEVSRQPGPEFSWKVEKLTLVHSLQGLGEYRLLGEWPLRGRIPAMPRRMMRAPVPIRPVPPYHFPADRTHDDE